MLIIFLLFFLFVQNTINENLIKDLVQAAKDRTTHKIHYDGSYFNMDYPNGDVPDSVGVCTDVIIRSYRKIDIDLQKEVHQDMIENFDKYPSLWGLKKPDKNIDHRRVPNLQTFFSRQGVQLPVSHNPKDYKAGDIVTWLLANNLTHIGIVVDKKSADGQRYLIVHNIGAGPQMEDVLFDFKITGHYSYYKEN